jgi:hypothetical protein
MVEHLPSMIQPELQSNYETHEAQVVLLIGKDNLQLPVSRIT